MTSREEIERLLNQTGRTLEGLPDDYGDEKLKAWRQFRDRKFGHVKSFEMANQILHQSDVIELLIGALRDALDNKGWVSVKERFPEKGDDVLISLCGCNVKEAKYCRDGIFEAAYASTYHATGMGAIVLTHWMPKPEPAET